MAFEQEAFHGSAFDQGPLVFTKVGQAVTVRIPICIIGTVWIKRPVVASSEARANPTPVGYFPAIWHSVTVAVKVCWIRSNITGR